jgi:FtsZ-binding cell division protein ZapB
MTMDEYREKESEELKGSKRRKEVEMRKRAKGDIWNTRVKVGYSMPLWLKEKINKESLEQGLYQWEYIAKMIEKAENCIDDEQNRQLREENEQLRLENERLRAENEDWKKKYEQLYESYRRTGEGYLRADVKLMLWNFFAEKLNEIITVLQKCGGIIKYGIKEGRQEMLRAEVLEKVEEEIKEAIDYLKAWQNYSKACQENEE